MLIFDKLRTLLLAHSEAENHDDSPSQLIRTPNKDNGEQVVETNFVYTSKVK